MALLGQRAELPGGGLGKHGAGPVGVVLGHADGQRQGAPEPAAWEERMRTLDRPPRSRSPRACWTRPSAGPRGFRTLPWPPPLSSPPARSTRPSAGEDADLRATTVVGVMAKAKSLGFL